MILKLLLFFMWLSQQGYANSVQGDFQSCNLRCTNDGGRSGSLSPSSGMKGLRGKSGPKGEKGERGVAAAAAVCKCESLIEEVDELKVKVATLLEERDKRSARHCDDVRRLYPSGKSGVYRIRPFHGSDAVGYSEEEILVYCELSSESDLNSGSSWIVFQRRFDGTENFNRLWQDYKDGFGDVHSEHWLGLETVHRLTTGGSGAWQLRINLEDFENTAAFAEYSNFSIGPAPLYTLHVGEYSGNAGNSLQSSEKYRHDGQPFTTSDHHGGCATSYRGAWWFAKCFYAHLNGEYFNRDDTYAYAHGIIWEGFRGHKVSLKKSMMMLRRV